MMQEQENESQPAEIRPGLLPAIGLWWRTLGYALPAGLYLGLLALGSLAILGGTCAACVLAFLYIHKYLAGALFLLGALGLVLLWTPFSWRTMWGIAAGQVAVFTETMLFGRIEHGGEGLFKHGRAAIAATFGEREVFHAFHTHLGRMLWHLVRTLDRIDDEVPELAFATKYLNLLRGLIVRHLQFVIVSYTLSRQVESQDDRDRCAVEGTCYVVQNGVGLLKTAVAAAVLERVLATVVWVLAGLLAATGIFCAGYTLVFHLPMPDFAHFDKQLLGNPGLWYSLLGAVVIGPIVGYVVSWAFLEVVVHPIATAMVLLKFHSRVQSQDLRPELAATIESGAFALDRLDWLSFGALGVGR